MQEVKDETAVALKSEALSWPQKARALVIETEAEFQAAADMRGGIKGLRKRIAETFKPIKQAQDAAKKQTLDAERALDAPLVEAEGIIDSSARAYQRRVEEARAAEQRKLEAEARKRAEELRLARALELEAAGDKEEAAAVIEAPIAVVRPQPSIAAPKAKGMASIERWNAIVVDLRALIAHVASHPECASYLEPNMPALNALARTQKNALAIPGVQAASDLSFSSRSN